MAEVERTPIRKNNKVVLPRVSPKLIELCKWKKIDQVNQMLDEGESPGQVHKWIVKHGFKISHPLIYEYAKMRRKCLVDGISIDHMVGIAGKPLFNKNDVLTQSSHDKLKSEIDALDLLIQGGYKTLQEWADRPITPAVMMAAIKLKNDLTDGNHGFLTNFGMEHLRDIENTKYSLIIDHLLSYIPEDKRKEAVSKIAQIEDAYYQTTEYYEEYLRASGEYSEEEIQKKVEKWLKERHTTAV